MNLQANLKNRITKSCCALLLLPISFNLLAQAHQATDLKDFKITVEKTEKGIKLESLQGSAWLDLSFSVGTDNPQAIDEYGMTKLESVSPRKDANLANFLFTITKTENRIVLKGLEGAAWTELSFTLAPNGKQTINQFGMTK